MGFFTWKSTESVCKALRTEYMECLRHFLTPRPLLGRGPGGSRRGASMPSSIPASDTQGELTRPLTVGDRGHPRHTHHVGRCCGTHRKLSAPGRRIHPEHKCNCQTTDLPLSPSPSLMADNRSVPLSPSMMADNRSGFSYWQITDLPLLPSPSLSDGRQPIWLLSLVDNRSASVSLSLSLSAGRQPIWPLLLADNRSASLSLSHFLSDGRQPICPSLPL